MLLDDEVDYFNFTVAARGMLRGGAETKKKAAGAAAMRGSGMSERAVSHLPRVLFRRG